MSPVVAASQKSYYRTGPWISQSCQADSLACKNLKIRSVNMILTEYQIQLSIQQSVRSFHQMKKTMLNTSNILGKSSRNYIDNCG